MEKKTIGQFIAALRRANGLTQKQLAEQLNVSDKAVSRWERDECAPDLSLIPVIADLFGVTSDEILRGERKAPLVGAESAAESEADAAAEAAVPDRRAEKQRKHLLDSTLNKFRIRSLIAGGVGLLGLPGAALCSIAVGTAFGGFTVGCVLLLSAAVAEAVLLLSARGSLPTDEPDDERLSACRRRLGETAFGVYSLLAVMLAFILPLLVIPLRYFGGRDLELSFTNGRVNEWNWLCFGAVYALVTAAVLLLGWVLYRTRRSRSPLLHRVLSVTAVILAGTAFGFYIINKAKPYPLVPWLAVFFILFAEAIAGAAASVLFGRRYDKLPAARRAKADALWPLKRKTLLITAAVLLVTASLLAIVHQALSWTDFVDGIPAYSREEVHEHDDKLLRWKEGGADAPYLMYFEEQFRQADPYMTALDVGSEALLLLEIGGGFAGYFIAVRRRSRAQAEEQQ